MVRCKVGTSGRDSGSYGGREEGEEMMSKSFTNKT